MRSHGNISALSIVIAKVDYIATSSSFFTLSLSNNTGCLYINTAIAINTILTIIYYLLTSSNLNIAILCQRIIANISNAPLGLNINIAHISN